MRRFLFIIYFIVLVNGVVCVANPMLSDTLLIEGVEVRERKPRLREISPAPVRQIDSARIANISGHSAAEALRSFAGVTLRDYGGIGGLKTIRVRSLGGGHTGVFLDGMPLNDVASGQADIGQVPLQGLEQISLHIGQPFELLQPARFFASASVVSLQTSQFGNDNKSKGLSAGIRTGSFGVINPYMKVYKAFDEINHASLDVNYTRAHGQFPYYLNYGRQDRTRVMRDNSDVHTLSILFGLRRDLQSNEKITFRTRFYNSERGLPGAVILYNPFASQRLWNRDLQLSLQYIRNRPHSPGILAAMSFSRKWLRYLDPDHLNQDGFLESIYNQHEFYVTTAISYPFYNKISISLASDLVVEMLEANLPLFAHPERITWLANLAFQASFGRLQQQAGILSTMVREQTRYGEAGHPQRRISPFLSLGYLINAKGPALRARFMYKSIFRMPTFNELYYTLVGNPDVKPENAHQLNAGITLDWHISPETTVTASIDGFYNYVTDKIITVPTKNLFVWSVLNFGRTDIRGLEWQVEAEHRFSNRVSISSTLNYTFQRAVDITNPGAVTYNHQLPYLPRETFFSKGIVTYNNLSLGYSTLFNGHRFVLGENIFENMLPSWWHHDLFFKWKFKVSQARMELRVEVNNLFDRQYEVIRSFPMPARGYFVRLGISI